MLSFPVASPRLFTPPMLLLEAGLVVVWSSGFVGHRFSIDHAPAMLVVFWRCLVVVLLLMPFVIRPLLRTPPAALLQNAGIGLLAMAGYLVGVVQGIALGVPAGLAALFADLLPIGVAILTAVVFKQRLSRRTCVGLAVGLVGVMLVTHDALALGHAPLWSYALPVAGMLSLAAATLWQKRSRAVAGIGLLPNLWLQCAVSSVVFAVLASMEGALRPVPSMGFAVSVFWTAILSGLGGYGLYWICLRRSTPTRVASVLYLSPAVTLVWAWAMFGEPLSWLMWVGTAISGLGVWMVVRGESERHMAGGASGAPVGPG